MEEDDEDREELQKLTVNVVDKKMKGSDNPQPALQNGERPPVEEEPGAYKRT